MGAKFDYFGARYYASDLSVWLSVDPLASKYPGISPYNYCFYNPIMFKDLWGLEGIEDPNGNTGNAGTGYEQTKDKQYLYIKGAPEATKKWDPNYEGGDRANSTQKGGYVDYTGDDIDFDIYDSEKSINYQAATGSYNYNKTYFGSNGEFNFLKAKAYFDINYGYINIGANYSTFDANIEARLGSTDNNITLGALGTLASVEANLKSGMALGQGGIMGLVYDANAGAYTAKGELNGSFTIFGVTVNGIIGGSVISAHVGISAGVQYNINTQCLEVNGLEHFGYGIGQKLGVSISVPISYFNW